MFVNKNSFLVAKIKDTEWKFLEHIETQNKFTYCTNKLMVQSTMIEG